MKEFIKYLKKSWIFVKNQKKIYVLYILSNIIYVLLNIFVPIVSAQLIVKVTNNEFEQIVLIGIVLFILECIHNLVYTLQCYFSQKIHYEGFVNIQKKIGEEIFKIENKCYEVSGTGVFVERLANDASQLINVFESLNFYMGTLLMNLGIFVSIFIINKWICLYIILMMLILFVVDKKRTDIVKSYNKERLKIKDETVSFTSEIIRGLSDIKMLNVENSFLNKFNKNIEKVNTKEFDKQKINRNFKAFREFLYVTLIFILLMIMVILMSKKELLAVNVIIIFNYFNRITSLFFVIGNMMEIIKNFNVSAERVFEIIDDSKFTKEKFGNKHIDKIDGNFEFKDVSFGYNKDQKVIDKMNFKINANETVAFVGKSGVGKSTIFKLLCKLYDIQDGEILIDGININELDKDSIRGNITIISQEPYIFNMSIKDNLKMVKSNITEDEIKRVCKLACLDDFIETLPKGYDTIVGENGVVFSGGQKQRLAIARALAQDTQIILFDEATSSLDNETQSKIKKAIDNMKDDYTIIIIAHRLSTIKDVDRIMYLDKGKVIAEGNHEYLLKNCTKYKKLYEEEIEKK